MSIPAPLLVAAAGQRGVFTRRLAAQYGCTDADLARWVKCGLARQVWRGILTTSPPPKDLTERHRELAHAISVGYGRRLAVSHQSAIVMAGLPTYDIDLTTVRFVRRNGGSSLSVPGIKISRCSLDLPTYELDRALVVDEAVAIAQVARAVGVDAAVVAADAALNRESLSKGQLYDAAQVLDPLGRARRIREVADRADGRAESPGETRLRLIAVRAGLDVEPQFVVRDKEGAFVARTDLRVRDTNVIAEFDGEVKYETGRSVVNEKKREDAIQRLGWRVERFVWYELDRPADVEQRLRS
ncbi:hypothetical protein [Cumulibacter soli]|uniref:hypothetical protein n=1 Tax=Cumulibacter soli TaxID=2546344 RepID=UPI001068B95D|nr:hypothetical protein [Cumulibacter soli]